MSNPTWPIITFKLNLVAAQRQGWLLPDNTQPDGNETTSEASNIPLTFTSWIPTLLPGLNIAELTGYAPASNPASGYNGYQFTAYGQQATYLKKTYANGSVDDLLIVVS
jgi:hypothetical protein